MDTPNVTYLHWFLGIGLAAIAVTWVILARLRRSSAAARTDRAVLYAAVALTALGVVAPFFHSFTASARTATRTVHQLPAMAPTRAPQLSTGGARDQAQPTPQPASANSVVSCAFSARRQWEVAHAFASGDLHDLDQLADSCHTTADAVTLPCAFVVRRDETREYPQPPVRECLPRAPPIRISLIDSLGPRQIEEWTRIALNGQPIGVHHITAAKPEEMLVISLPDAGPHDYTITVRTRYMGQDGVVRMKERTASVTLLARDGSTYSLFIDSNSGSELWLQDITPTS